MSTWDLCVAWNWEFDVDFLRLLGERCNQRGHTLLEVTPGNLEWILQNAIPSGDLCWKVFLDRASDSDPHFQQLVDKSRGFYCKHINPQEKARWAHDKATMHLEFLTAGIETPYTIILPPFREQSELAPVDLSPLEGCFAIKPACGGGGEGVILEATSWEQVLHHRTQLPAEKYLLQSHIFPHTINGRPAWFRVIFCDGAIYPCWWDPKTHLYARVTADERYAHNFREIYDLTRRIANLCQLNLFSTEIALTPDGDFVVVDYVNDPVDLRIQSRAVDGVPDVIVENIALRLVLLAERFLQIQAPDTQRNPL